ncbi:MAG: hypothetical protein ACTJFR_09750 [Canibacter sp.]
MDHNQQHQIDDGLINELALVEAQPLEERAEGFQKLYEQLVDQLQSSDGNQ